MVFLSHASHVADVDVTVSVITISTSKWQKYGDMYIDGLEKTDDESGKALVRMLGEKFRIVSYRLAPDDMEKIRAAVEECLKISDAVVTTGGTGITPRDVTIEAVEPLIEKRLDGFGEIFRMLSYQQVGSAAILSRAIAGIRDGKAIFCLPGSPKAVKLGAELILDSLKHVISHARGLR